MNYFLKSASFFIILQSFLSTAVVAEECYRLIQTAPYILYNEEKGIRSIDLEIGDKIIKPTDNVSFEQIPDLIYDFNQYCKDEVIEAAEFVTENYLNIYSDCKKLSILIDYVFMIYKKEASIFKDEGLVCSDEKTYSIDQPYVSAAVRG